MQEAPGPNTGIHWGTLDLFARVLGLPQHGTTNWVASATEISYLTVWRLAVREQVWVGLVLYEGCEEDSAPGLPAGVWRLPGNLQFSLTCRSITSISTFPVTWQRDWGQGEKGKTEDEMAGWPHGLDGRGFE